VRSPLTSLPIVHADADLRLVDPREPRRRGETPIVSLATKTIEADSVAGFDAGVDDDSAMSLTMIEFRGRLRGAGSARQW
jgi:DNA-binding response OmpR family regulator